MKKSIAIIRLLGDLRVTDAEALIDWIREQDPVDDGLAVQSVRRQERFMLRVLHLFGATR